MCKQKSTELIPMQDVELIKKRSVTQSPGWERNSPGKMNISCFLLYLGGQGIKIIKMKKLCNAVSSQTKVDLLKIFKANVLLRTMLTQYLLQMI